MSWMRNLVRNLCPPCPDCPPPVGGSRPGIAYAYYGTMHADIPQIAGHVTMAHIGSWGDWTEPGRQWLLNDIMALGHEAMSAGIPLCMYTLDFLLFTPREGQKHALPRDTMVANLIMFADRLRAEGLLDSVGGFYVIDEPNIPENNLSDTDVTHACYAIKDVFSHYIKPIPPMAMIYGSNFSSLPGLAQIQWAGFDDYGAPIFSNGKYNNFKSHLTSGQKTILVPGGASPWRENPQPFYDKAQTDLQVAMIMPFHWFGSDGIGANGMAPQYRNVGNAIKTAGVEA